MLEELLRGGQAEEACALVEDPLRLSDLLHVVWRRGFLIALSIAPLSLSRRWH